MAKIIGIPIAIFSIIAIIITAVMVNKANTANSIITYTLYIEDQEILYLDEIDISSAYIRETKNDGTMSYIDVTIDMFDYVNDVIGDSIGVFTYGEENFKFNLTVSKKPLDAPQISRVDGFIQWDSVGSNVVYYVYINGVKKINYTNTYSISDLASGEYTFTVQSVSSNDSPYYTDSIHSNELKINI